MEIKKRINFAKMKIHLEDKTKAPIFPNRILLQNGRSRNGKRKRENRGTISMKKEARGCAITRCASA